MPPPYIYKIHESVPADAGLNSASQKRASTGNTVTTLDMMEVFDVLPCDVRSALHSGAHGLPTGRRNA
jgi:hypothetical protein